MWPKKQQFVQVLQNGGAVTDPAVLCYYLTSFKSHFGEDGRITHVSREVVARIFALCGP